MKSNQAVVRNSRNRSVECVRGRCIAASTLPTLLVWFILGFMNPGWGLALQGGPPGQGNPPDGAVVSAPPGPVDLPVGQEEKLEEKLAAIAAAAGRREWQALRKYLLDGDAAVQAAALTALSEVAPPEIQDLLAILRDMNHPTRWQALWLLDQSVQADQEVVMAGLRALQADQQVVVAVLRNALRDADPSVRDSALQAFAGRQDANACPGNQDANAFPGTLDSPETDSQPAKLAATSRAASGGDTQALRSYLQDVDAAVQGAAFDALAAQDTNAAVSDLVASIRDSTNPARWQSLQLLDQSLVADEAAVRAALMDALNDSDPLLRDYALQALARRAQPEGMGALIRAFQDSDASTRLAVIDTISQTEAGLQFLREALSDSDEAVRNAAAARLSAAEAGAGQAEAGAGQQEQQ